MKTIISVTLFVFSFCFSFSNDQVDFEEGRISALRAFKKYKTHLAKHLPEDHSVVRRIQTGIDILEYRRVSHRKLQDLHQCILFGDSLYDERSSVPEVEKRFLTEASKLLSFLVGQEIEKRRLASKK